MEKSEEEIEGGFVLCPKTVLFLSEYKTKEINYKELDLNLILSSKVLDKFIDKKEEKQPTVEEIIGYVKNKKTIKEIKNIFQNILPEDKWEVNRIFLNADDPKKSFNEILKNINELRPQELSKQLNVKEDLELKSQWKFLETLIKGVEKYNSVNTPKKRRLLFGKFIY